MKKRIVNLMLTVCLTLTMLFVITPKAQAAGYYTESDLSDIKCTILSDPVHAGYVNMMMRYHIMSATDNYRVGMNLENGSSVVFFFDGCSDNVNDPVYGNYNNYHLSAYCAVVRKVDGKLKIVYESENCATIPDSPRNVAFNDGDPVPTVLDGVYNILTTNHKGRYASLHIAKSNWNVPVIRCTETTSYISTSNGINIHARRLFPDVPPNSVGSDTFNSTGCFNVGLVDNNWSEYNKFIFTTLGIPKAIVTTPEADGVWTQCSSYIDKGVVIVDRSQYKNQLVEIYGGDNTNTAKQLVAQITAYSDSVNAGVTAPYLDVNAGSWQYGAVDYALENSLMTGKGKDTYGRIAFDPDNSITREEFVQVLYNAEKKPAVSIENKFPDVTKTGWYRNAVLWANQNQIVSGLGNGKFGVGLSITRQDLAIMLYKYAALRGKSREATADIIYRYADGNQVSAYAKVAMDWAVTNGVLSGKGVSGKPLSTYRLDPAGTATRAECAAMLKNFMQLPDAPVEKTLTINTPRNTVVYVGGTLQIDYTYSGNKSELSWSSTDTSKATVNSNGIVTGVAAGPVTIKVTNGTTIARVAITVENEKPKVTSLEKLQYNAPLYDGVVKYAGDYMTFKAYTKPDTSNPHIVVTSSNTNVVSVSWNLNASNINDVTLNFKNPGTAVVKIASADGAMSESYTIYVKGDYDCNPGSGTLTPEQFVNAYNGVLSANGMSTNGMPSGYLVLTLRAEQLTWAMARKEAEGTVHAWWKIGYRTVVITFEKIDENGNYVFYERGY